MNSHPTSSPVSRAGRLLPALLFSGFFGLSAAVAQTQVATDLVNDNFDTLVNPGTGLRDANGRYSSAEKASTWWFVNSNSLDTSAVVAQSKGGFSGNAVRVNFSATNRVAISTFAATTLEIGDSLSVSFDYLFVGALNNNNRDPQFGLFNGTAPTADVANGGTMPAVTAGYQVDVGTLAAYGSRINKGLFTPFADAETRIGDAVQLSSNFAQGEANHFSLVITRTAEYTISASFYLDGVLTLTGTDTSATDFTFNEFIFRGRTTGEIDNFVVTHTSTIPESSAFGLLMAGAGLTFALTRRRRAAV